MINIHSDSNSGAEIHHLAGDSTNVLPDTTINPDNSRKTVCFYCSEGHGTLRYSYVSVDKFACHNFACANTPGSSPVPRNCGMHGSDEWFNI